MSEEDLGLKMGSRTQKFLEQLRENHEKALITARLDVEINEFTLKRVEELIAEEEENFK